VLSIRAETTVIPAGAGDSSEANLQQLAEQGLDPPSRTTRIATALSATWAKTCTGVNLSPSPAKGASPYRRACSVPRTFTLPQIIPSVSARLVRGSTVMGAIAICEALGR
jgi:hypothetical protein